MAEEPVRLTVGGGGRNSGLQVNMSKIAQFQTEQFVQMVESCWFERIID